MSMRDSQKKNLLLLRWTSHKGCEDDHFPVPLNTGGEATVPCCISRHDMKDRYPLEEWPMEWISAIVSDFPKLSRITHAPDRN